MKHQLIVVLTAAAVGCGSSAPAPTVDLGPTSIPVDGSMLADDGGGPLDLARPATADLSMPALADGGDKSYSLSAGYCFTFATATAKDAMSMSCGDLYALSGANVDLSNGVGSSSLCDLPGPYGSLAAVPTDYSGCAWTSYLEGGGGLAKHGLIVRDMSGAHHYRAYIVSNTQPALIFSFLKID
jgi:hypothetical protein